MIQQKLGCSHQAMSPLAPTDALMNMVVQGVRQLAKHFGTLTEGQIVEESVLISDFKIEANGFFTGEDCTVMAMAKSVQESFWKCLRGDLCSETKFCARLIDVWQMILNMAENIGKGTGSGVLIVDAMKKVLDVERFKREIDIEGFQWKPCTSRLDGAIHIIEKALGPEDQDRALAKRLSEVPRRPWNLPLPPCPDRC